MAIHEHFEAPVDQLTYYFLLGYFIAGGVAGVVSRTATAPLDRLKVYLIAQTGQKDDAIRAAKDGSPLKAAHTATRPLVNAVKELWRMGGIRSLFAGQSLSGCRPLLIEKREWIECGQSYARVRHKVWLI